MLNAISALMKDTVTIRKKIGRDADLQPVTSEAFTTKCMIIDAEDNQTGIGGISDSKPVKGIYFVNKHGFTKGDIIIYPDGSTAELDSVTQYKMFGIELSVGKVRE